MGSFVVYTSVDVSKHFLLVRVSTEGHCAITELEDLAGFSIVGR